MAGRPPSGRDVDSIEILDNERLTAEMAFDKYSSSAVIKIRRRLPDFLHSVKLKYVKLGYGYSCNLATVLKLLFLFPLLLSILFHLTGLHRARFSDICTTPALALDTIDPSAAKAASALSLLLLLLYASKRNRPVYLVDFACCLPDDRKLSVDSFLKMSEESGAFHEDTLQFQRH